MDVAEGTDDNDGERGEAVLAEPTQRGGDVGGVDDIAQQPSCCMASPCCLRFGVQFCP